MADEIEGRQPQAWEPGYSGKGALVRADSGQLELHIWKTFDEAPFHSDAFDALGIAGDAVIFAFWIDKNVLGIMRDVDVDGRSGRDVVVELDPRLADLEDRSRLWSFDD